MPAVQIVLFCDGDKVPALEFLDECRRRDERIYIKLGQAVVRLEKEGWQLTRPESDTLRDGIHELRVSFGGVHYRLLYFFHRDIDAMAILSHGCTKEKEVPSKEIDIVVERMRKFKNSPETHSYTPPD